MKVGVSIKANELSKFPVMYRGSDIKIEHVQITGLEADLEEIDKEIRNQVFRMREQDSSIEISLHAYNFINLAEPVKSIRQAWVQKAKKVIKFAYDLELSFVNIHLGFSVDAINRRRRDMYLKMVTETLKEVVEYATMYRVELHIENQYSPCAVGVYFIGDCSEDFEYIFKNIESPYLKLCYDYGHGNLDKRGIEILRKNFNKLGSIHAHDNDQITDLHVSVGNSDFGTIDWYEEILYLSQNGYRGTLILESEFHHQMSSIRYLEGMEE